MAFSGRAVALTPADDWRDVWPEIQAGDFATAAQRLQLYVTEWPLDHQARRNLAIMQFAKGSFPAAAQNLEREMRLRKGYARTEPTALDFDSVECWHYLAKLRAGQNTEVPVAQHQPSLLLLLSGQTTLNEFLEQGFAAQDAAYEKMEPAMRHLAETLQQVMEQATGKKSEPAFSYTRPEKQTLIAALACSARLMLGEQALGKKDIEAARDHLTASVATNADGIVEYHIAKAELTRLAKSSQ